LTTRVKVQSTEETESNHNSPNLNSSTVECAFKCAGDVHFLDFLLYLLPFRSDKTGGREL
jgi:hypothetical protein